MDRLFTVTPFHNNADLAAIQIRHHLYIGVAGVVAIDNGSTDATPDILSDLARKDRRVMWRRDNGPYEEGRLYTEMARTAFGLGAEWAAVVDADEFLCLETENFTPSARLEVILCPTVNFVQARDQHRFTPSCLLRMTQQAVRLPEPTQDPFAPVAGRSAAYVEAFLHPKVIVRSRPGAEIFTGGHSASGSFAELEAEGAVLHAPLYCFDALRRKATDYAARIKDAKWEPGIGRKTLRWGEMTEAELQAEWAANSHEGGVLDVYGYPHPTIQDLRLWNALQPIIQGMKT